MPYITISFLTLASPIKLSTASEVMDSAKTTLRGFKPRYVVTTTKASISKSLRLLINILIIAILSRGSSGVELTFELPDNAKECFYEVIEEGKTSTVEFQVCYLV